MAFREVTVLEIKEVLRRWLRGETKSEIARQCGAARGTVRSYIKAAEADGLCPGQALGGHLKTGHSWTLQNRPPRGGVRDGV